MFRGRLRERGQVLIIFVFALIGLVGITALAVDGGNVYADRRHAQNTADAAAMAGALYRVDQEKYHGADPADCGNIPATPPTPPGYYGVCGSGVIDTAKNMANTDQYPDSAVQVLTPPLDGQYADCSKPDLFDCHDYVEVIIDSHVQPYFAQVLGIRDLENRVEAVALAEYSPSSDLFGGESLVELGTGHGSCPSDFNVGGSGTITLNGGGIFVNSSNTDCAYKQTSCRVQLILAGTPPATIQAIGGADTNGCTSPTIAQATTQYPFPPKQHPLKAPLPECSVAGTFSTVGTTTTYQPGNYYSYSKFPVNNDDAVLKPGVYCINDLNNFQNNQSLTGNGVMIYMRPTGQIKISGEPVNLTPPTSGPYQNYLIYGDWNSTSSPVTCSIEGRTDSHYTGLIYVPYCNMTISGTSDSTGFDAQVIAYTISLTGTNTLNFTYSPGNDAKIPEVNNTGLFH